MSRLGNLGLIFASPGKVAKNVAEDPHWVIPLVIILLVSFVMGVAIHKYQVEYRRAQVEKIMRDAGRTEEEIASALSSTPRKKVLSGAGIAVFVGLFMILIPALILNGISSVMGEKVGFRRMFSFMSYSSVILALGDIIRIPIMLAKGSIDVRISLAALAPSVGVESPLGTLLNSFDVFSIWMLVAVCAGFSALSGSEIKKASAIVVALWAVGVAILMGLAVLRTAVMPG
jgi:hypothetical protein